MIYHIAVLEAFRKEIIGLEYSPSSLNEEGFIHCTQNPETLLKVAEDYFKEIKEHIIIMKINTSDVIPEVRFEAAAPINGGGTEHLKADELFPHIYGPFKITCFMVNQYKNEYTLPNKTDCYHSDSYKPGI